MGEGGVVWLVLVTIVGSAITYLLVGCMVIWIVGYIL